jgi:hypothetical protein
MSALHVILVARHGAGAGREHPRAPCEPSRVAFRVRRRCRGGRRSCHVTAGPSSLPETSPLYRVVADHFATLERVHEERFELTHGPLRAAARVGVEAGTFDVGRCVGTGLDSAPPRASGGEAHSRVSRAARGGRLGRTVGGSGGGSGLTGAESVR